MNFNTNRIRIVGVGAACAVLGAGAGAIAQAGASTQHRSSHDAGAAWAGHRFHFVRRRLDFGAVHGDLVVPYRTGFATVTFDRGRVDSVSGQQLTITEGTKRAVYKQLTLTIPSDAKVRNNGTVATLDSLTQGERALVLQTPRGTFVVAHTPRG